MACSCPACSLRRISPALVLIALGALLLAHMLSPGFNTAAVVAGLFVVLGALGLARHLAPRPADHLRYDSLFFPLLLLALGVLFFLRHSLPNADLGAWVASYWPLLLILWGLTRLVEHYTRPPRQRGGLNGGEIVLLIFIIIAGVSFSGAYRFQHSRLADYWGVNFDTWNPFYQSYSFSAATHATLAPASASTPATIVIRGFHGDVTLLAGPPGALQAAVSDTVHAESYDAAQRQFQSSQPRIENDGGQWLVYPSGDDRHATFRSDLKLTLPASTPVVVQSQSGDVTISDWSADLDLHTAHGDITLNRIHGNVLLASVHDAIHFDQLSGNVTITGNGSDVSLANIAGDATLQGEFTGALNFSHLAHGIRFNSQRTSLAIATLPGTAAFDLGQIAITNAQSISLRTRNQEIAIHQFSGPLDVRSRNDSISLTSNSLPTDPITVANLNADITLALPPASRFNLVTTLRNGDLRNDFDPAASSAPTPLIHLETTSGDIVISRQ